MDVISTFLKRSFKVKAENKRKKLLTYDVQSNQCENNKTGLLMKFRFFYNNK